MNHESTRNLATRNRLATYVAGYILSVGLTVAAYLIVTHTISTRDFMIGAVAVLAFVQFVVQLLFFLHLGQELRPRFKLLVFLGMVSIVAILVIGSLWIMSNLNYRMTPSPKAINNYMKQQDGDF
jgi:cytochrome o ubiquinol oxidase operon protein cyoD